MNETATEGQLQPVISWAAPYELQPGPLSNPLATKNDGDYRTELAVRRRITLLPIVLSLFLLAAVIGPHFLFPANNPLSNIGLFPGLLLLPFYLRLAQRSLMAWRGPDQVALAGTGIALSFPRGQVNIPWDAIKQIASSKGIWNYRPYGYYQSQSVDIFISEKNLDDESKRCIKTFASLWSNFGAPMRRYPDICPDLCFNIRIPLDGFVKKDDRVRFVDLLNTHASSSVQGNLTAALSHSGISFTQLWLEDLQSNRNSNSNPILLADHDLSDGRYSIIRPLCTSGQSTIYLALDSTDQTRVVLKQFVLPSDANLLDYTIAAHPLEIEAKVLSRLDHPNIPRLKDKLVEAGMAYLVCPFVDGMSLSEICKSGGPLEVGRVKTILVQAAILLQYLHSLQPPVVHRDFCPDNLILSEGDKVFLVDFGVAAEPNINPENVVVGKPSYIAPEQFRGRAVTQSDLYSLGAVAYFLLTGAEPEPLTQSNPGAMDPSIPQALDAMIEKLTAQEVKDRFQSATEVLSDLNLCLLTANH